MTIRRERIDLLLQHSKNGGAGLKLDLEIQDGSMDEIQTNRRQDTPIMDGLKLETTIFKADHPI